ncbi:DNA-methyltransferase [Paraburkholderia caribensis]|uniref:DNA-methyltransferase n=1 Tax=Paraburkholderia caribensis TaxID=75105 RepID=UPI0007215934|nr:site-specific DNA-methyltransferase [Paraburkholderia caribensis]ALP65508.1 DNA methylase N-4 [Paraburkholderia caribensis]AUT55572.1 site-specific DNA-methyltransferase [Paraburkholderia caribensis]
MRDEFEEPQPPALDDDAEAGVAGPLHAAAAPLLPVPAGIELLNRDFLTDATNLPDGSIDLIVADPPYGLGKDYGNDSDMRSGEDFLAWTRAWLELAIPKLKPSGSLYIFCTWQYAPEIFVFLKSRLTMVNEIIWDRRVPSMGGTTRRFTSVHDNIGYFAVSKDYYFDLDPVRIPYDAATKKARSRKLFEGSKWLEMGYNPKDVWSVSRLHRQHAERVDHPTQKPLEIVERMVLASCPPGGRVLDPFMGSGTTAVACARQKREFVGYEINESYCAIARERVSLAANPPEPVSRRKAAVTTTTTTA